LPLYLDIPPGIIKEENYLEITVQNLSANYIRKIDKEKPGWKKFYDINFVNVHYQPFDASEWELVESGLLGPVRLYPAETVDF